MMKSKLSSKSLVKVALKIIPLILFLSACNSSVSPSFLKENITQAVTDICKKEYQIDTVTTLTGHTLWVYMPLENIITKPEKPEKYLERFLLEDQKNYLDEKVLKVNYSVRPVEEKEKSQEMALNKSVNEKIFSILQVIRRVLFSMDHTQKDIPKFFCIVTADIRNGFELKQIFYLPDLKKLSYNFISQTEYQHRILQDTAISAGIIGDRAGSHLNYRDITLEEFLSDQIQTRIKLKFQKPEVEANVDIDKEVLKIVTYTLSAYQFKDFSLLELTNLANGKKIILNQTAILANSKE
ncbi:MAG TPA: hypothetical protein PL125_00730 [Candidatus Omnitrophota bacterium]|nr:hypothetical protein [Candidatus Omnitrophota bacterium]HPT38713.1 hypothetical protein [Candidatus Omnitrophota bacterium]